MFIYKLYLYSLYSSYNKLSYTKIKKCCMGIWDGNLCSTGKKKTTNGNWQYQGKGTVPNIVLRKSSDTKKGTFD